MNRKKGYITRQAKRLSAGEINRRRFVMQALSAGVTMPTALSLASRAEALVPRKGGLFKLATACGTIADRLNPALSMNCFTRHLNAARGNTLIEKSESGDLIGALADSFEKSGKSWAFDLRRDITFHNGKTLSPEDVIATFDHHRASRSNSALRSVLANITRIRRSGAHQVIFELAAEDMGFPAVVTDHRLIILPSEDGRIDPETPYGTGGYRLDKFDPGRRAEFTRNPNYWKQDTAHFDAVELISIPEITARQHAVMNGDVHFADRIDPKAVALIQRMPTLRICETEGARHLGFAMRTGMTPANDVHLLRALELIVPRQELVDKILLGHGRPGSDMPVQHAYAEAPLHGFDPQRAAMHYRRSQHTGRIELAASEAAFIGAVDTARLMAAAAKEAGIDIVVVEGPSDTASWSEFSMKAGWRTATFDGTLAHAGAALGSKINKGAIVAMSANDISAHSHSLAHAPGAEDRIIECWWFA